MDAGRIFPYRRSNCRKPSATLRGAGGKERAYGPDRKLSTGISARRAACLRANLTPWSRILLMKRKTPVSAAKPNPTGSRAVQEGRHYVSGALRFCARFCVPAGDSPPSTGRRAAGLFAALRENRLEPKEVRFVHSFVDRPAARVLISAVKDGSEGIEVLRRWWCTAGTAAKTDEIRKIYHRDGI